MDIAEFNVIGREDLKQYTVTFFRGSSSHVSSDKEDVLALYYYVEHDQENHSAQLLIDFSEDNLNWSLCDLKTGPLASLFACALSNITAEVLVGWAAGKRTPQELLDYLQSKKDLLTIKLKDCAVECIGILSRPSEPTKKANS